MKPCPHCQCPYGYSMNEDIYACPECGHEWNVHEVVSDEDTLMVLDAHGNQLQDGDTVVVIKDLPVRGAPRPIRAGTKVKGIRLTDGDHNISCKIPEFGPMALKSEFVKKA